MWRRLIARHASTNAGNRGKVRFSADVESNTRVAHAARMITLSRKFQQIDLLQRIDLIIKHGKRVK